MRLLERLFCSANYFEYQNLTARRKNYGPRPYLKATKLDDSTIQISEEDQILDEMDVVWRKLSWMERRLIESWIKKYALLQE